MALPTVRSRAVRAGVLALAGATWLLAAAKAPAQEVSRTTDGTTPLEMAEGAPAGSYPLSGFESVNPYNGRLSFSLPLLPVEGRGAAVTTVSLPIEASWWVRRERFAGGNDVYFMETSSSPVPYGPGTLLERPGLDDVKYCPNGDAQQQISLTRLTFKAPDGTEHELRDELTEGEPKQSTTACPQGSPFPRIEPFKRGTRFVTADGSAATFLSDSEIEDSVKTPAPRLPSGDLVLRDGTRYRIDGGRVTRIRDRNGNTVEFTYADAVRVSRITDSLNREVRITYGESQEVIHYASFAGGEQGIAVDHRPLALALCDSCGDVRTLGELFPEISAFLYPANRDLVHNPRVVSTVTLANGRSYSFRYNAYGELAKVTLPTNGGYEYDWSGADGGSGALWVGGSTTGYVVYRRVRERRVLNWGHVVERTVYDLPQDIGGAPKLSVDVTHFDGATPLRRETHIYWGTVKGSFFVRPTQYPGWRDGREDRTEIHDPAGALLRTIDYFWAQRASIGWAGSRGPANDVRLVRTTTTLHDGGLVASRLYNYDRYNNVTAAVDLDYDGSELRRTTTSYVGDAPYALDPGVHIRNLPREVQVHSRGSLESRTVYDYDTSGPVGYEVLPTGWRAVGALRGNATRVTRDLYEPGGTRQVVEDRTYDLVGNLLAVAGPRCADEPSGPRTEIDFHDHYGVPNGNARANAPPASLTATGRATFAHPTVVARQIDAGGQWLREYTKYDYSIGRPTDREDANGVVASTWYDAMSRLAEEVRANAPAGPWRNKTRHQYNDFNRKVKSHRDRNVFGDELERHVVQHDELGREANLDAAEIDGLQWIGVTKAYDARGRLSGVTNPLRVGPGSSAPTDWTLTEYDALDRPVSTTTSADGAQVTYQYWANQATVTDPAGSTRTLFTDALGRVARIVEYAGTGTEIETRYVYNARDQVTSVHQSGPGAAQGRSFSYDSLGRLVAATNPESGTVHYRHDARGNVVRREDARGVVATLTYDFLDRLKTRAYSDATPAVEYRYDEGPAGTFPKGRLSSVSNGVARTDYEYDALGRITRSIQTVAGEPAPFAFLYEYDLAGNLRKQTYPSGRTVETDYDTLSRITGVKSNGQPVAQDFAYWPHGAVERLRLGNGDCESYGFNRHLQPDGVSLRRCGGDSLFAVAYAYGGRNNNGNLLSQTQTVPRPVPGGTTPIAWTQAYAYDGLNRLRSATEGATWSQGYDYDPFGNRAVGGYVPSPGLTPLSLAAYDPRTNRLVDAGYDAAGNLTIGLGDASGQTHAYDAENRLSSFASGAVTFLYDGEGRRVRKSVRGVSTTTYAYDALGRLAAEYSTEAPPAPGTRFLTPDALGSVRVVTDGTGAVLSRHDYLPFGEEVPANLGARAGVPGYETFDAIRQRFTGKERDHETGLDYFGARYFSAAQGRFTSADPAFSFSAHVADPQQWNRYAYVRNNPFSYTDPDGRVIKAVVLAGKVAHAAYKGYDLYTAVAGVVDSGRTVFSLDARVGTWDRLKATASLVGELSGVSDAYKGAKGAIAAVHAVDKAGEAAKGVGKANEGIIYLRRDAEGGEYVGRAKSERRFEARQREHADANPDAEFEFEILERVPAGSGRSLEVAEEDWIRAGGGPGRLQNKRHEMKEERYRCAGGTVCRPE